MEILYFVAVVLMLWIAGYMLFPVKKVSPTVPVWKVKNNNENFVGVYQQKEFLTTFEKYCVRKLIVWAEGQGCFVLRKVRFLDLVELKSDASRSSVFFRNLQELFLDFVIFDHDFKVKVIVLIDDGAKNSACNAFISQALGAVEYRVVCTKVINDAFLESLGKFV